MSRQRGLFSEILKNFFNSLKPKSFKGNLIGEDYLGNQYYEVPSAGHLRKAPARYYKPLGGDVERFDEGVPPEWEAWLRQRRKLPPTSEEIEKNLQMIKMKQENALKIEEKFKPKGIVEPDQEKFGSFPKYDDLSSHPGKNPN